MPRHLQPDPAVRRFGMGEAVRLTGVNRQTLAYWDRTGFLCPSLLPGGRGSGKRRQFSFQDVLAARVARRLRGGGISLQALRRVVEFVQRLEGPLSQPLACRYLVVNGQDVEMLTAGTSVSLLSRPGQVTLALSIDLEAERESLREEVYRSAA